MSPILELRAITKEYRGVPAVKDVNFTLNSQEIHALVGENGAGKSTLTKIIAGAVMPDRSRSRCRRTRSPPASPWSIRRTALFRP
jgi:simple sugar transport system ATP-binding protein